MAKRPLVYGGGVKGIMGIVSRAALSAGGDVVGVIPYAILAGGGEGERFSPDGPMSVFDSLREDGRERAGLVSFSRDAPLTELAPRWNVYGWPSTRLSHSLTFIQVVVDSMHERKVEMARRSCGFIGLPGGYGTFEEVFEVTTWTQIGIHSKRIHPNLLASLVKY